MINHIITKKEPLEIKTLEDDYYIFKWMDNKGFNSGTLYVTKEFIINKLNKINVKFRDCIIYIKPINYQLFMMAYVIVRVKEERAIKQGYINRMERWDETREEVINSYFANLRHRNSLRRTKRWN